MTSVTFPTALGGDGSTVSDDADPTTGLRNAGYKTRFVPALQQTLNMAQTTVNKAAAAAASEAVTVTKAAEALASELAAAGYANQAMVVGLSVETLRPSIKPSLLLDFARAEVVPPSVTFTRASTATRIGPSGLLETVGINVPRIDYDPVTRACKGLLIEEQRTNLFLNSEVVSLGFASNTNAAMIREENVSISPDGATTADKIYQSGAGVPGVLKSGVTTVNGASYVTSIFAKAAGWNRIGIRAGNNALDHRATVDLTTGAILNNTAGLASVQAYPNGWYRISISGPVGSTNYQISVEPHNTGLVQSTETPDGTNGIFIWGAQLEAGSFTTSYIPTTSASVTRAADVATVNDLSPWYRADEGTLFAEGLAFGGNAVVNAIAAFGSSGSANLAEMRHASALNSLGGVVTNSGSALQVQLSQSVAPLLQPFKAALAIKVNDFAFSVNGQVPSTDVSGAMPLPTVLGIGQRVGTSGSQLNGHVRQVRYYPGRLTNAQLQALTTQ